MGGGGRAPWLICSRDLKRAWMISGLLKARQNSNRLRFARLYGEGNPSSEDLVAALKERSHTLLAAPILLGIGRYDLFHLAHWRNVWKHLQRK